MQSIYNPTRLHVQPMSSSPGNLWCFYLSSWDLNDCLALRHCHSYLQMNLFRANCIRCPADVSLKIFSYIKWILLEELVLFSSLVLITYTGHLLGLWKKSLIHTVWNFHTSELYGHVSLLFLHLSLAVIESKSCLSSFWLLPNSLYKWWL